MIGVRHAEEPGQTANADICFVPARHEEAEAVPAVSGSSGRLVVSAPKVAESEPTWPGKVFEQEELSYVAAMDQYVAEREAKLATKAEVGVVKDWLASKHWETAEELTILLAEFIEYYNDRPHQGREFAGLSPNEYAARKVAA